MSNRLANRCPNCGGIAQHWLTDSKGNNYYECNQGLTTLGVDNTRGFRIETCDTIIDNSGDIYSGIIAYKTNGKYETITVSNGRN